MVHGCSLTCEPLNKNNGGVCGGGNGPTPPPPTHTVHSLDWYTRSDIRSSENDFVTWDDEMGIDDGNFQADSASNDLPNAAEITGGDTVDNNY